MGYGLARDHDNSRPAEVLFQGWDRGKPVAFDVTFASTLTPVILNSASASVGAAAYAAECVESMQPMTPDARSWGEHVPP